jgi:hypothetical protein
MRTALLALLLCLTAQASAAPPAPAIVAPAAGAVIADGEKRAALHWQVAGAATVCELQFLFEGDQQPLLKFFSSGDSTVLRDAEFDTLTSAAEGSGRELVWRIRGYESTVAGPWSEARRFTLGEPLPYIEPPPEPAHGTAPGTGAPAPAPSSGGASSLLPVNPNQIYVGPYTRGGRVIPGYMRTMPNDTKMDNIRAPGRGRR